MGWMSSSAGMDGMEMDTVSLVTVGMGYMVLCTDRQLLVL